MEEDKCKFNFEEVKYLHKRFLSYVTDIREFRSKTEKLEEIDVEACDNMGPEPHYSCRDHRKSKTYFVLNDGYIFDIAKDIKNDRKILPSFHSFLKRINSSFRKASIFFEDHENYD